MINLVSDRDALFTAGLWTALHKLTGVKLKMSTPKPMAAANGQIKP
jgi:hypothetical protein